jgi:hypothetical protein
MRFLTAFRKTGRGVLTQRSTKRMVDSGMWYSPAVWIYIGIGNSPLN